MSKVKLFLTIITILIAVVPITTQIIIHRDNPLNLILPPTFADIIDGGISNLDTTDYVELAGISFQLPMLVGEPVLFPNSNTVQLIYTFTNPLDGQITITAMDADIMCIDHHFLLGKVSIDPATLEPNQTLDLNVNSILYPQALTHIATEHQGQSKINTEYENFSVELIGIKITMEHRKLGYIQLYNTED